MTDTRKMLDILSLDNEVFRAYCFWSSILVLKIFFMSILTPIQRFKNKVFSNPEDLTLHPSSEAEVKFDNPTVERVRRAHLNDLENILPFFTIGLIYVLSDPKPIIAINLFRVLTVARFIHTFVYAVYVVPQPARALSFFVAMLCSIYMAITSIIFFFK